MGLPKGRTNNVDGRPSKDDPKDVVPLRLRRSLLQWLAEYGPGERPALLVEEIIQRFHDEDPARKRTS